MRRFISISLRLGLFFILVQAGYEDEELQHNYPEIKRNTDDQNTVKDEYIDYYTEPKYSFNYAVHDPHTGDEKQHVEEREGDVVQGTYSLKEPDGTTRIVQYQADNHNGFNAQVHKIGISDHSQYKY